MLQKFEKKGKSKYSNRKKSKISNTIEDAEEKLPYLLHKTYEEHLKKLRHNSHYMKNFLEKYGLIQDKFTKKVSAMPNIKPAKFTLFDVSTDFNNANRKESVAFSGGSRSIKRRFTRHISSLENEDGGFLDNGMILLRKHKDQLKLLRNYSHSKEDNLMKCMEVLLETCESHKDNIKQVHEKLKTKVSFTYHEVQPYLASTQLIQHLEDYQKNVFDAVKRHTHLSNWKDTCGKISRYLSNHLANLKSYCDLIQDLRNTVKVDERDSTFESVNKMGEVILGGNGDEPVREEFLEIWKIIKSSENNRRKASFAVGLETVIASDSHTSL